MNYSSIVFLFIILFTSKVNGQIPDQKYGMHKDMALGSYFEMYKNLNTDSLDVIKNTLYKTLKYKDIEAVIENEMENVKMFSKGWSVLMRTGHIDWKDKKYEVIDILHDFSQQILSGKSYLTISDLDKCQGGNISKTHPAFFPFYAYWVMLQIDTDYSLKYINEIIDSDNAVLGSSSYQKKFKTTLFYFLQKHYKSDKVVNFCIENSERCGIEDTSLLIELRRKSKIFHLENQGLVWDYFIENDPIKPIDGEKVWLWYWNLVFFKETYPDPDINILFFKIESSKNYEDAYYLLYSLCFFLNRKLSSAESPSSIKTEVTKAINLVDKYYLEHGAKLKFANEYDDNLKPSCAILKDKIIIKN